MGPNQAWELLGHPTLKLPNNCTPEKLIFVVAISRCVKTCVADCPHVTFAECEIKFTPKSTFIELNEKLALLEEHERLNASLAALTRHFAHVQLRLQQVVSAPTAEDREVQ